MKEGSFNPVIWRFSALIKEGKESLLVSMFVIHKHQARQLHYDLRLEIDGVLKSWAVPKSPPTESGLKRLAVQTEDHPLPYADFEGNIPEGEYGAGTVTIWDKGKLSIEKYKPGEEILFYLNGEKMKGAFALLKLKQTRKYPGKNHWLFLKRKGP